MVLYGILTIITIIIATNIIIINPVIIYSVIIALFARFLAERSFSYLAFSSA